MLRPLPTRKPLCSLVLCAATLLGLCGCSAPATEPADDLGPLSQYLTALWDTETYTQEKIDADQQKTEELVAECMTDLGFTYQPNTSNGGGVIIEPEDGAAVWGSEEFVKQYGYGIATSPGMEETNDGSAGQYIDVNADYVASLSESERHAYEDALWGPAITDEETGDGTSEGVMVEYDWTQRGCQGAAQHEVQLETSSYDAAREDPAFVELFAEIDDFYTKTYSGENASPKTTSLGAQWYECMVKGGFTEYQVPTTISQQMVEAYNSLVMPSGPENEWNDLNETEQQKFAEHEIAVAVADYDCRQQMNYDDQITAEYNKLEEAFVEAHRAQLDALVSAHSTHKAS